MQGIHRGVGGAETMGREAGEQDADRDEDHGDRVAAGEIEAAERQPIGAEHEDAEEEDDDEGWDFDAHYCPQDSLACPGLLKMSPKCSKKGIKFFL
jgi:hypothetical protein